MIKSAVDVFGNKVLGVILTGMGNDGLAGCQALAAVNGKILAQDRNSCVVWGMPRAVTLAGICYKALSLNDIGPFVRRTAIKN